MMLWIISGGLLVAGAIFLILSLSWPPLMRRTFWLPERIRFWQMVRTLWRMGMKPAVIFDTLAKMYSENGRNRNRGSVLCTQIAGAINKRTFGELGLPGPQNKVATPEDVLALWCSPLEAVLFRVGSTTGNMSGALSRTDSLLKYIQEMRRALIPAMVQGGMLILIIPGILWALSEKMLPAMTALIPRERWTLHVKILDSVSSGIQQYGLWICCVFILLIYLCIRSIPRRGGILRRGLEFIPPWSVYRALQGTLFLLSAGALLDAGMKPREVLDILRTYASPWLGVRLDAASFQVRSGRNLGQALHESGYRFPDTQSAIFLSVAGTSRDIAQVMTDWGEAQMPVALTRIKSLSSSLIMAAGLIIGAFLIYVMFAITSLTMTLSSQGL